MTVVIPTYNYGRYVTVAIRSALNQTYPNVELVVVDDGSTDDTPVALAQFETAITVVRQHNRGVAAARNHGVEASTGEILAFLDADDYWEKRKLERQMALLKAGSDVGLVHCAVQDVDGDGNELAAHLEGAAGWSAPDMLLFRSSILGGGSGALIPRQVFQEVGGFDEEMSTSADFDLYVRVAARWRVAFVPDLLVFYRVHASNMHRDIAVMERDMMRSFVKVFSSGDAPVGVRRMAYARLHLVLAGSYLRAGNARRGLHHATKACVLAPSLSLSVLGAPLRRLLRVAQGNVGAGSHRC